MSREYPIKSNAQSAINNLKKLLRTLIILQRKPQILDEAGEVIAISELLWSESSRDYSIRITRKEANNAELIDQC